MKAKKLLAMLCCGLLAVSLLAGCGGNTDKTKTDDTQKEDTQKEDTTKTDAADPSKPAGYYQFSYEVEGLGLWVNYIHLYEESSIGNVFYAGYASNQITFAGTYEVEKASCDYSVAMTREDQTAEKLTDGTADYTITFYSFDGTELGSCGYDGTYIYNDTTGVAGTGAENCAFERDPEGIDSKYGQADSGYVGEKGVGYLKAYSEADETCTVTLNHDGSYSDMMTVEVVGTWEMGTDGVTYTLTPDSSSDTGATLVVAEDGASATYTPDGGEAVTLKIDVSKPVAVKFAGVIPADANSLGQDVDAWINCYNDKTCEAFISAYGVELSLGTGEYETSDDGVTTLHFDGGDMVSAASDEGMTVEFSWAGTPIGDIAATLTQE